MELFIKIKDGQPFEHPIMGDNFRQAFPDIDTDNLPPEFASFVRVPCPNDAGIYQVYDTSYSWSGQVVQDTWTLRDLTLEEREEKTQLLLMNIRSSLESLKAPAQAMFEVANEAQKQALQDFCNELDAWAYSDPINLPLPPLPPEVAELNRIVNESRSQGSTSVIGVTHV